MGSLYRKIKQWLPVSGVYVVTILDGEYQGAKGVWDLNGTLLDCEKGDAAYWKLIYDQWKSQSVAIPGVIKLLESNCYLEYLVQEPELIICGGGHISQELGILADYLEYPYVILDDREEFCNSNRFPGARACICGEFSKELEKQTFSANAYYVIVTRGHKADLICLQQILKRPRGYVGMIGSRGKVGKTMALLEEQGYDKEVLGQIHAPIGLAIGGETPKEIAISIVAQLIQEKNKENPSSYLDRKVLEQLLDNRPVMMVTVIGKRGSAPRGMGSRMIVGADGILCGTIGGGMVEYEAEKLGKQLLNRPDGIHIETYQVNETSAAALGMWCGGEVDVMFEWL